MKFVPYWPYCKNCHAPYEYDKKKMTRRCYCCAPTDIAEDTEVPYEFVPDPLEWMRRAKKIAHSIIKEYEFFQAIKKKQDTLDGQSPEHIKFMLEELIEEDMRSTKASRWLGYIQCWLVVNGHSSVHHERYRNANDGEI